jgi:hypothetical protein
MCQHIGFLDELVDVFYVFGGFEVGGKAFFIAVDGMEEQRVAVDPEVFDRKPPAGVASSGAFYFYDTGSQVRQPETGRWSGEVLAEFQYGQSV